VHHRPLRSPQEPANGNWTKHWNWTGTSKCQADTQRCPWVTQPGHGEQNVFAGYTATTKCRYNTAFRT
jgi:hypothetical protein